MADGEVAGGPRRAAEGALALAIVLLALLAVAATLHGAFAAYTWGKFRLVDYGRYVNMVWNSGHGRFFTVLVDHSYLSTHISPTLLLLGPFFRVWDHPFLLSLLQWAGLLVGAAVIWRTATVHRVRRDVAAAIVLFFVASPFTQAPLLCEFHGVGLYFPLLPWLHACLDRRKAMVWLPLALVLGVREDAGAIVLPMLLYFAIRDGWRPGWVLAACALAWSLFAIAALPPLLGGEQFVKTRTAYAFDPAHYGGLLTLESLRTRAAPLLPCVLVAAPFLAGGGWRPIAVFPLAAVGIAATAAEPNIYLLRYHYPAAIIVLSTLAVLEATIRAPQPAPRLAGWPAALFLVAATLVWHRAAGFLPGGGHYDRVYGHVHPSGLEVLRVAQEIPKTGVLLCPSDLAGFVANRADLLTWEWLDESRHRVDLVFLRLKEAGRYRARYRAMLESGEFGVRTLDRGYAIFERGHSTERNADVIRGYLEAPTARSSGYGEAGEGGPARKASITAVAIA